MWRSAVCYALFLLGLTKVGRVFAECNETSVVITFQADIDIPMLDDFPPDATYRPYTQFWGLSRDQVRQSVRSRALQYFGEKWGIDLRQFSDCVTAQGRRPGEASDEFCLFTDSSDVTTVRRRPLLGDVIVWRDVAKFFHVINPEAVGYKIVQSSEVALSDKIQECPIPVIDSAFVLDILADDVFLLSIPSYATPHGARKGAEIMAQQNDRLLYGWYTIPGLTSDTVPDVIHYESKMLFDKTASFTPLAWKLYHNIWGEGESEGLLAQPQVPMGPQSALGANPLLPPAPDVKVTSWRNILKFPAQPCEAQGEGVLAFAI